MIDMHHLNFEITRFFIYNTAQCTFKRATTRATTQTCQTLPVYLEAIENTIN
jgi:hypothetical protein